METNRRGPKAVPHQELFAAVDRLVEQQRVKSVRVEPAAGPVHGRDAVVINKADWDALRRLSSSQGLPVPEDRIHMGTEGARQFAAALRTASDRCPGHARKALSEVLSVLFLGRGLRVSGVQ